MKKFINSVLAILVMIIGAIVIKQIELQEGLFYAMAIAAYTKSCTKNVAGNSAIYYVEVSDVTAITVTAGEISALTATTGFKQAQADLDSIVRTEEGAGTGGNIAYTHRVEAKYSKPTAALNILRISLAEASACGILVIVTDGNGTSWLVGYNETDGFNRPLRLVQDAFNSGAAPTDEEQKTTIALEGVNGYVSLPFNSTLGATITGGTALFIV